MIVELFGVYQTRALLPESDRHSWASKTARAVDVPRGDAGFTLRVKLVDQDGHPVKLALPEAGSDSIVLSIGHSWPLQQFTGILAPGNISPNVYDIVVQGSKVRDYAGKYVYDVFATKGGVKQQVVGASYLTFAPSMGGLKT